MSRRPRGKKCCGASSVRKPPILGSHSEEAEVAAGYHRVRRNYADADELRAALASMPTGKTGRSVAVEHLLHLPSDHLEPWLLVTDMIFAGDAPDVVKLGTMNALAKDLEHLTRANLQVRHGVFLKATYVSSS